MTGPVRDRAGASARRRDPQIRAEAAARDPRGLTGQHQGERQQGEGEHEAHGGSPEAARRLNVCGRSWFRRLGESLLNRGRTAALAAAIASGAAAADMDVEDARVCLTAHPDGQLCLELAFSPCLALRDGGDRAGWLGCVAETGQRWSVRAEDALEAAVAEGVVEPHFPQVWRLSRDRACEDAMRRGLQANRPADEFPAAQGACETTHAFGALGHVLRRESLSK